MRVVEMVAVVHVVESNRGRSEDVERRRVCLAELGGDVRGVDEDRSPALHAISEAVEDLVAWGVLEVSTGNMR